MTRYQFISPHYDDAVWSCGGIIGKLTDAGHEVRVLTVCGGVPFDNKATDYDRACGFQNATAAMHVRRREDRHALHRLGAHGACLPFVDSQYEPSHPAIDADMIRAMCGVAEAFDVTFAPLGLGHADHRRVAMACASARAIAGTWWVYEELPYRVQRPDLVPRALRDWWVHDPDAMPFDVNYDEYGEVWPEGDIVRKEAAVRCYGSQLRDVNVHPMLVPERTWRLP